MSTQLAQYNFPDVYSTLVSGYTGTVKYISSSGSNSNNGDTVSTPYLTVDYAYTQTSATARVMFVILEGTYTMTAVSTGNSLALRDSGNERVYVGCPGRTIIQWTASTGDRDSPMVQFTNTASAMYGIIAKRNNNGRDTNYKTAFFKGPCKGNFYNCVFSETNSGNLWSYQYDNYAENNIGIRNCTIYNAAAPAGNYTNAGTCLTIDTVFNTTCTTGGTETNVLKSQTVNSSTYVTTGVTTAGVYSGTYSWSATITLAPAVVSGSTGATVTTSGRYKYYTFTSSGTLTLSTAGGIGVMSIAGGGGGGYDVGGGGGAGGLIFNTNIFAPAATLTVTVGAGGTYAGTNAVASNGSNTTITGTGFTTLTSVGGGGGGSWSGISGAAGGSGGGGTSNTTTVAAGTSGQGYAGGAGSGNAGSTNDYSGAAGGGGADQAGGNGTTSGWTAGSTTYGYGGRGKSDTQLSGYLSATSTGVMFSGVRYIGGGGGAASDVGTYYGVGGAGGGGIGGNSPGTGVVNTGAGGGGGGLPNPGASGGSGLTVISVLDSTAPGLFANVSTVSSGNSVLIELVTTGVANGNIAYTITGVTSAQINGASLTGNFVLANNYSTITIATTSTIVSANLSITANTYTSNISISYPVSITTAINSISSPANTAYLASPIAGQMNIPDMVATVTDFTLSTKSNGIAGQMNIPDMVATVTDVTLGTKSLLPVFGNLQSNTILPYTTITTSTAGPIQQGIIKLFGDNPNREYWF